MGVHGLTTYLRDNRRVLSKTVELWGADGKPPLPVVVDGWSFIYTLYHHSALPWVYGGEYSEFHQLVQTVVKAWLQVGLHVHFVFDGPYPDIKFSTCVSRLAQSHIQPGLLFFRTSPTSRANPRSLNESRILPPLAYGTCVHALKELQSQDESLHIHFADEEGDPYAVELAGRLKGYVVGNDSDFVVLNAEGYMGYIPINDMVWHATSAAIEKPGDPNDDFQVVTKPKAQRKTKADLTTGNGLIPPPDSKDLKLTVTAFSPVSLAQHFKLPVTLLPLLGAIVGNDFTAQKESSKRRIQSLLFERHLSVTQRLEHAAAVIRNVLNPNPAHRKSKYELGSVLDLIERTVNTLLNRFDSSTLGPGEVGQVVDNIVEATLQYAIPKSAIGDSPLWPSTVCPLHPPEACSFLPMVSRRLFHELQLRGVEDSELLQIRESVINAYRAGSFSPKNMDVLSTATCWPKIFLENPDAETVGRSIGQPIRRWVYSILDDAVGLPDLPTPGDEESSESAQEESDDEDIIDVVEEDSEDESELDPLAPLKGELSRLRGQSEDKATDPPASISSRRTQRASQKVVVEYLRRGIRVGEDTIKVAPLSDILESIDLLHYFDQDAPLLLTRPEGERLSVMLRLLECDTPEIRALQPTQLVPVLAARWVAHILNARLQENWSKEREKEVWSAREARCLISAFSQPSTAPSTNGQMEPQDESNALPNIVDRHVQLTAQALAALEAIEQLAQALLLGERVPSVGHLFSGKQFHTLLNELPGAHVRSDTNGVQWTAVTTELTAPFREEVVKRTKKVKAAKTPLKAEKGPGQGFYALLASDMS